MEESGDGKEIVGTFKYLMGLLRIRRIFRRPNPKVKNEVERRRVWVKGLWESSSVVGPYLKNLK